MATHLVTRGISTLWEGSPTRYIGGLLLGTAIDNLLFGVLMIETWTYFQWFRNDRLKFKILVWVLFALNTAQTGVTLVYAFMVFVQDIGKWAVIVAKVNVEFEIVLILEAVCTALAQVFFLERAFKLSKHNIYLAVFCTITIAASAALGLASSIATITAPAGENIDFSVFDTLTHLIIAWKSGTMLVDVVLTSTIVWFLVRSKNGWARTNDMITSLIRFTCEAQILPLLAGLFFLITYVWDPNSNLCLIGSFSEAKLAAIAVTHVLNSRGRLRHDWTGTERSTERGTSGNATTKGGPTRHGVSIFTETIVHRDVSNPGSDDLRESQNGQRRHRTGEPDPDGISLESFEHEDALKRAHEARMSVKDSPPVGGPFINASEISFAGTDASGAGLVQSVGSVRYQG